jgi:predicted PurR-regulated permease PerM
MAFKPMDTQSLKTMTSKDLTGLLIAALMGLVAWLGTSLINRVDELANSFNAYALKMESRVTALEQRIPKRTE